MTGTLGIGHDPRMRWSLVPAFEPAALAFLRADPVAHTVLLGVLTQHTAATPAWAQLRDEDGRVIGAAWRTPPWGLGVTAVPEAAARALADLVMAQADAGHPGLVGVDGVVGPARTAAVVAEALAGGSGRAVAPRLVETLYRIDTPADLVTDPRPRPSGRPRAATRDDLPLLTDWWTAFTREAGTVAPPDVAARVRQAVDDRSLYVWDDGAVCAMVGARDTGAGVARIGPVYTPPASRGRGQATALTEHAVRALFAAAATVVTLYADDANPTSTGIYRRLGFRPVLAWADLTLV